jgi:hypothetical protein
MRDEVQNLFVDKIIKGKIKSPNRLDFSLSKWNKEWGKVEEKASERDSKTYKAGVIIDSLLVEIRKKLDELYKKAPNTNFESLMLSYAATSNRTTTVAVKLAKQESSKNVHAALIEANFTGTKQGLSELAHGAVDGVQLAIRNCLWKIGKEEKIEASKEFVDELSFIQQESWLSQLYCTYLHLWQCILWSDYELEEVDKERKLFNVKQPVSLFEIAFLNSANRKDRLAGQNTLMATRPMIRSQFLDDRFVMMRRENKKRVAYVESLRSAGDKLITFNTEWRIRELDLHSYYPKKWLTDDYGKGFSLSEALDVFRCLMLMANALKDKFPENDSAFNVNKLKEFCPTVQIFSLKIALCNATKLVSSKITKILDFITIKASPTSDLWCQPLIKTSRNEYALLVSALCSPSIFRIVERWADEVGIDLGEKGYTYEETVIEELNEALEKNSLVVDYDKGLNKRIKIDSGEEEFDLLARIDDMILVGEAKSIVTTDSEISKFRAAGILEHAGQQVTRKTKFLKENLEEVFGRLDWTYNKDKKYTFVQCILNSGRVFVGHKFCGVPVIDEKILSAYFLSNKMNLLTVVSKTGYKEIAWYQLYSNLEELKANFLTYVSSPPQLSEDEESFEYNNIGFPYMSDDSYKLSKSYLVLKQSEPLERMKRKHHFPVIKSEDFEVEAVQIKVSM